MAWLPAVISGAASLLGGRERNRASAAEAERNRRFQMEMSSTAHQREVADLRAAGLNPILSATGGRGASTPSGSMAQFENIVSPAVSSALAASRVKQELSNLKDTGKEIRARTRREEKQGDFLAQQRFVGVQNVENLRAQRDLLRLDEILKYSQLPGAQNEAMLQEYIGPIGRGILQHIGKLGLGIGALVTRGRGRVPRVTTRTRSRGGRETYTDTIRRE